ncbi:uncharacterized protein, partial [Miscanthus floridulus]|uniref:uncharacterized protein n=1 Tax=Miscanthus floridulus TaxID=154761 RepID=UPI003459E48F
MTQRRAPPLPEQRRAPPLPEQRRHSLSSLSLFIDAVGAAPLLHPRIRPNPWRARPQAAGSAADRADLRPPPPSPPPAPLPSPFFPGGCPSPPPSSPGRIWPSLSWIRPAAGRGGGLLSSRAQPSRSAGPPEHGGSRAPSQPDVQICSSKRNHIRAVAAPSAASFQWP